jgi:hypothetical protein
MAESDGPGRRGAGQDDELDGGLTPEQLAAEQSAAREALRRLHVPVDGVCEWCGQPFPCPDSQP